VVVEYGYDAEEWGDGGFTISTSPGNQLFYSKTYISGFTPKNNDWNNRHGPVEYRGGVRLQGSRTLGLALTCKSRLYLLPV